LRRMRHLRPRRRGDARVGAGIEAAGVQAAWTASPAGVASPAAREGAGEGSTAGAAEADVTSGADVPSSRDAAGARGREVDGQGRGSEPDPSAWAARALASASGVGAAGWAGSAAPTRWRETSSGGEASAGRESGSDCTAPGDGGGHPSWGATTQALNNFRRLRRFHGRLRSGARQERMEGEEAAPRLARDSGPQTWCLPRSHPLTNEAQAIQASPLSRRRQLAEPPVVPPAAGAGVEAALGEAVDPPDSGRDPALALLGVEL